MELINKKEVEACKGGWTRKQNISLSLGEALDIMDKYADKKLTAGEKNGILTDMGFELLKFPIYE